MLLYATHALIPLCLCLCVREAVCLLAPVVWIRAARLDRQANHLPGYKSHHATLRCPQTPPHPSPLLPYSVVSHSTTPILSLPTDNQTNRNNLSWAFLRIGLT